MGATKAQSSWSQSYPSRVTADPPATAFIVGPDRRRRRGCHKGTEFTEPIGVPQQAQSCALSVGL